MVISYLICLMMSHLTLLSGTPSNRVLKNIGRLLQLWLESSLGFLQALVLLSIHALGIIVHHTIGIQSSGH